ncbi:WD repeat-containing protein 37 [Halotydeus destructor]|nr:WD repeat-containing protein 37 [Halotydeus destructor]
MAHAGSSSAQLAKQLSIGGAPAAGGSGGKGLSAIKRASSAGSGPVKTGGLRTARSSTSRTRSKAMAKAGQDGDSLAKERLHLLFGQIEKEFDVVFAENAALRERIEALEELLIGTSNAPSDGSNKALQQKLATQLKRDSMVAASQISQKIKSTYKLKTSGKIFNKTQSNIRGQLLGKYEWHKDGVWYISTTNKFNRTFVASASADGTACVCEVTVPKSSISPIATYVGHQGCSVNCVKFHPKYDLIITASGDSGAHIWRTNFEVQRNSEGGEEDEPVVIKQALLEIAGHSSVVVGCDFTSTVDQCVTASWDRTANLYDLHTGELVVQLVGHDQELTDVAAHPSAPLIVTSSHDTTFRLWDFREAIHSVCVFQGHSDCVTSACFIGQDKVVSGADDRTVKLWDLKNMRSPLTTIHFESPVNKLGVSPNNAHIAIPLENRNVRVYDTNGNRVCRLTRNQHERMVTCASFVPHSAAIQLFTCAFDRKVCWWSLAPAEKS